MEPLPASIWVRSLTVQNTAGNIVHLGPMEFVNTNKRAAKNTQNKQQISLETIAGLSSCNSPRRLSEARESP